MEIELVDNFYSAKDYAWCKTGAIISTYKYYIYNIMANT